MASLPNRCLEVVAGSVAWERSEMARAMAETVETVSSARPPKVSATSGIKSVPVARHAEVRGQFPLNTSLEGMPRGEGSLSNGPPWRGLKLRTGLPQR